MRIEHMPDAVRGQAILYYRLPMQSSVQAPRRVQAVQQSSPTPSGAPTVASAPPDDSVTLDVSPEGREAARKAELEKLQERLGLHGRDGERDGDGESDKADDQQPAPTSSADERMLRELSQKDSTVRAREQAVRAAAGGLALGTSNYSYQVGPDGRLYVVDGAVSLDVSEVPGDPEATLLKAEQVQQAALAARARRALHEQEGVKAKEQDGEKAKVQ